MTDRDHDEERRRSLDDLELAAVDPRSEEAVAAVTAYVDEIDRRFPGGFDPGDSLLDDAHRLEPPGGVFLVVRSAGHVVGCGGVQTIGPDTGEIKRMWVAPEHRGRGVGARLLTELERRSRGLGHTVVRLDTNSELFEAVGLYRRAGYRSIGRYNDNPYPDHFFEKRLGEVTDVRG